MPAADNSLALPFFQLSIVHSTDLLGPSIRRFSVAHVALTTGSDGVMTVDRRVLRQHALPPAASLRPYPRLPIAHSHRHRAPSRAINWRPPTRTVPPISLVDDSFVAQHRAPAVPKSARPLDAEPAPGAGFRIISRGFY